MKWAFFFSILFISLSGSGQWTQVSDFEGTARDDAICFKGENQIFLHLLTGREVGFGLTNDHWQYNALGDVWFQRPDMPGSERQYAVGFNISVWGFVATGWDPNSDKLGDIWSYDDSFTWQQRASIPASGRSGSCAFVIGNQAYLVGGRLDNDQPTNELWSFNLTNGSWTQLAPLPGPPREWAAGFALDSYGYVCCGYNNGAAMQDTWRYDPNNDSWTQVADLPGPARYGAEGFSVGWRGVVVCGAENDSTFLNDVWAYDALADQWSQLDDFPGAPRKGGAGAVLNDVIYYGTGSDATQRYKDFYKYDLSISIQEFSTPTINIWPNPAADHFIIDIGEIELLEASVNFLDATGRVIFSQTLNGKQSRFDTHHLSAGYYFIQIINRDHFVRSEKLMIIK